MDAPGRIEETAKVTSNVACVKHSKQRKSGEDVHGVVLLFRLSESIILRLRVRWANHCLVRQPTQLVAASDRRSRQGGKLGVGPRQRVKLGDGAALTSYRMAGTSVTCVPSFSRA